MHFRCTLFGTLLALGLTTSCATSPALQKTDTNQAEVISRWHSCIDRNIDELDQGDNSPNVILESTLVTCQGHKRDVLATFPRKYEKRLDTIMTNKAYESGFERLSRRHGVKDSVSTSYQRLLEYSGAGF